MTERMPLRPKDKKENDADEEKKEKLRKIKIVPIELTFQKYEKGEKQVNQALKEGYHILKGGPNPSSIWESLRIPSCQGILWKPPINPLEDP